MRRYALLSLLVALGACDFPEYPAASNPYDPEHPGARRIAAVDSIWISASTPTSATLAWSDPSSFERGFRLFRNGQMVAVTAPDKTTYTFSLTAPDTVPDDTTYTFSLAPLLVSWTFGVAALGDDGVQSPRASAIVRYNDQLRIWEIWSPPSDGG
ncbi:MAG: hypothetical protein AAF845_12070 [Bacteroidota bacterium]